eukprot:3922080-Pleurochrysis_carterae.AAC.5
MSCGGTTFVWRIAPYGLTKMPTVHGRAAQYVCRGLQSHDLGSVNREGEEKINVDRNRLGVVTLNSWLNDLTIAAGGVLEDLAVQGDCEILLRVFDTSTAAGMTLNSSKSHFFRKELECWDTS